MNSRAENFEQYEQHEQQQQQQQQGGYDYYKSHMYHGQQQPYQAASPNASDYGSHIPEMAEITVLSTKLAPNSSDLEQVITRDEDPFANFRSSSQLLSRLGVPLASVSRSQMMTILGNQVADVIELFYDSFIVKDGKLVMVWAAEGVDAEAVVTEKCLLVKDINEVYFTAKLAALRFPNASVPKYRQDYTTLKSLFDTLLETYTQREDEPLVDEDLFILISLALLVSALAHFIDAEERNRTEPALALLLSLTSLNDLVTAFKYILPPAHQSRLFTLTLYRDLQRVEAKLDSAEEFDQIAKLKALMELAFLRYGDFFLRYYADEVMQTLGETDLIDCPLALWDKATHDGDQIQLDFGPSFLVSMLKYQWGIIKDFNGISPDPSNSSILYHTTLENLFEFLFDQAQQLFLFVGALNAVLSDGEAQFVNFNTDADTLITVYMEMMHHLDRICTALNDSYDVLPQEKGEVISRVDQMTLKQLSKVYILLLAFSICSIQLSLTGPLQITTAPSISAVLEQYISKSDFSTPIKECFVLDLFIAEFVSHSPDLIRNYSMIRGLSMSVLLHLEGKLTKVTAFNTGISWNMFSFFILMSSLLLLQLLWITRSVWAMAHDSFLV